MFPIKRFLISHAPPIIPILKISPTFATASYPVESYVFPSTTFSIVVQPPDYPQVITSYLWTWATTGPGSWSGLFTQNSTTSTVTCAPSVNGVAQNAGHARATVYCQIVLNGVTYDVPSSYFNYVYQNSGGGQGGGGGTSYQY